MFQNAGELIMYVGGALLALLTIYVVTLRVLLLLGKREKPSTLKKLVIVAAIVAAAAIGGIGDHYRAVWSKDAVLSFYGKNIPYSALTDAQRKNVSTAAVMVAIDRRMGQDITKYRAAIEKYLVEQAVYEGVSPEQAEENAKSRFED